MNKCCTKCMLPKPIERFRVRTKKGYTYTHGKCMDCESKEQKTRTDKIKHTPEYKKKIKERGRQWRKDNPEKVKKQNKAKRSKPGYKEWVKQYYKNNSKVQKDHKVVAKKWQTKAKDDLSDTYVINKIFTKGEKVKRNLVTPEMIEAKRLQLMLIRKTRKNDNA